MGTGDTTLTKPPELQIREADISDIDVIVRYNICLAEESEGKRLDSETLKRGVAKALGAERKARYFLACREGVAIGQLMLTHEWSDWRDGQIWWIQSVYVEPASRRRGVYRALHRHVLETARSQGDVVGLRLYVEQNNTAAQQTYQRSGMCDAGYLVYEQLL